MRLLLDTHALIWWWNDDPILSPGARDAIMQVGSEVYVSAVSGWEIATKVRKGKLLEARHRLPTFERDVSDEGFGHLPVTTAHGLRGGSLEGAHKDPFDRLLAAQALIEGFTILSCDREMGAFGCEVLW